MSTTSVRSRQIIDKGPGRDRLFDAVINHSVHTRSSASIVSFTLGDGSSIHARISALVVDEPKRICLAENQKDHRFLVSGATVDGRKFEASYNAHNRSGTIEFLPETPSE